jgi:hypothetical protein
VGVVWNQAQVERGRLKELNALIAKHSERVEPQDLPGWVRVMDEHDWDGRGLRRLVDALRAKVQR